MDPLASIQRDLAMLRRSVNLRMVKVTGVDPLQVLLTDDEDAVEIEPYVVNGGALAVDDIAPALVNAAGLIVLGSYDTTIGAGLAYKWRAATGTTDPLAGYIRHNIAQTVLAVSETDKDGNDVSAFLNVWDNSTASARGQIIVHSIADPSTIHIYAITGAQTDSGAYRQFPVSLLAESGTIVAGDQVSVQWTRSGDTGPAGPSDPQLDAIAAQTPAANQISYWTGLTTAALTDFTSQARQLLDDTTFGAMRTTLGLAIGTDVQTQDAQLDSLAALANVANLTAIAGLTMTANSIPYFTGPGTTAQTDLTGIARQLLDDTSFGAMRTTLFAAGLIDANIFIKAQRIEPDSDAHGLTIERNTDGGAGAYIKGRDAADSTDVWRISNAGKGFFFGLDAADERVTNVATPTALDDAVTKAYVDDRCPSFGTRFVHNVWGPISNTAVGVANTSIYGMVQVLAACTLTGIEYKVGTTPTGNIRVALFDSTGARVANCTTATAQGATNARQKVAFDSTYAAAAGIYYACITFANSAAQFWGEISEWTSGSVATGPSNPTSITPPTASIQAPKMMTY